MSTFAVKIFKNLILYEINLSQKQGISLLDVVDADVIRLSAFNGSESG